MKELMSNDKEDATSERHTLGMWRTVGTEAARRSSRVGTKGGAWPLTRCCRAVVDGRFRGMQGCRRRGHRCQLWPIALATRTLSEEGFAHAAR